MEKILTLSLNLPFSLRQLVLWHEMQELPRTYELLLDQYQRVHTVCSQVLSRRGLPCTVPHVESLSEVPFLAMRRISTAAPSLLWFEWRQVTPGSMVDVFADQSCRQNKVGTYVLSDF